MRASHRTAGSTESVDDYLKAILALGGAEGQSVSGSALAQRLGVAPASITNMLQKLASLPKPFVEYEKHRGVRLAAEGKRRALEIVRHHRLLETFLFEVLDYPIEEVHEEAERLEHFISERFEERIAAKLGHPKFDPHGHCIPAMNGKMPTQSSFPLTSLQSDGMWVVDSVSDHDPAFLKRLRAHGIGPGVRIAIVSRSKGEFGVRARAGGRMMTLARTQAESIRIRAKG